MKGITWLLLLMKFCLGCQTLVWQLLLVLVRDFEWPLPDNKCSEHAGPGVTTPGGGLAPAGKHSSFPGSISKGHGAMKNLQVIWHGSIHPL